MKNNRPEPKTLTLSGGLHQKAAQIASKIGAQTPEEGVLYAISLTHKALHSDPDDNAASAAGGDESTSGSESGSGSGSASSSPSGSASNSSSASASRSASASTVAPEKMKGARPNPLAGSDTKRALAKLRAWSSR